VKRLRGLTLIEILVVVAILGVLMALLTPVFSRARISAKKVESTQNLRILGLGQLQYAEDNANQLASNEDLSKGAWYRQIRTYCKTDPEKICPPLFGIHANASFATGYALNDCLSLVSVYGLRSSRTVMLVEHTFGQWRGEKGIVTFALPVTHTSDHYLQHHAEMRSHEGRIIEPRQSSVYNGLGSYFFLDGHVGFLHPTVIQFAPFVPGDNVLDACRLTEHEQRSELPIFKTLGDQSL